MNRKRYQLRFSYAILSVLYSFVKNIQKNPPNSIICSMVFRIFSSNLQIIHLSTEKKIKAQSKMEE